MGWGLERQDVQITRDPAARNDCDFKSGPGLFRRQAVLLITKSPHVGADYVRDLDRRPPIIDSSYLPTFGYRVTICLAVLSETIGSCYSILRATRGSIGE